LHKLFISLLNGIDMTTSKDHALLGSPPSAWVCRFLPLLQPKAEVIDVACGSGRHLRLLHAMQFPVIGIDRDLSGVADLQGKSGLQLLEHDLEDGTPFPLAGRMFGGVVVINYLHRPLLPALIDAVAPGGLLIYETFAQGNERLGRPRNPDFLLLPGELLEAVRGRLEVVAYEAGEVAVPKPAVVQRIAARRSVPPV